LTGYTPAHAIGPVDVIVNNMNGRIATAPRAFTFIGPTITGVNPNHGPVGGGTAVGISGSLFQSGATVTFDGLPATNVTFYSASTLVATAPADQAVAVPNRSVDITVRNPDGSAATLSGGFMYQVRSGPEIPGAQPPPEPSGRAGGGGGGTPLRAPTGRP
jgi:hypothetical protein